jgi:hypothetical protein
MAGKRRKFLRLRNQKENMTTQEFEALPLNEQRKSVASDVINQLNVGKYLAKNMVYVQFNEHAIKDNIKVGDDMKSTLHLLEDCTVCAYGSLMLSTIRFKNSVNWDYSGLSYGAISKGDSNYTKPLKALFTADQLKLIEDAFEGWDADIDDDEDSDSSEILRFYYSFDNPTDRMIAIMENLIANNGEFVL